MQLDYKDIIIKHYALSMSGGADCRPKRTFVPYSADT